ncbi:hypothetical protein HDK77DRAFT_153904 [Phyllosticta capitalensis]
MFYPTVRKEDGRGSRREEERRLRPAGTRVRSSGRLANRSGCDLCRLVVKIEEFDPLDFGILLSRQEEERGLRPAGTRVRSSGRWANRSGCDLCGLVVEVEEFDSLDFGIPLDPGILWYSHRDVHNNGRGSWDIVFGAELSRQLATVNIHKRYLGVGCGRTSRMLLAQPGQEGLVFRLALEHFEPLSRHFAAPRHLEFLVAEVYRSPQVSKPREGSWRWLGGLRGSREAHPETGLQGCLRRHPGRSRTRGSGNRRRGAERDHRCRNRGRNHQGNRGRNHRGRRGRGSDRRGRSSRKPGG